VSISLHFEKNRFFNIELITTLDDIQITLVVYNIIMWLVLGLDLKFINGYENYSILLTKKSVF